jgi:phosphoserine phosphatase
MSTKSAAFFRAEGTVLAPGVLSATAYIASNAKKFGERALRLGLVALAAPLHGLLGQTDRALGPPPRPPRLPRHERGPRRRARRGVRRDILKDKLLDQGVELLKRARAEGHRVVLLSDGIAQIMEPLRPHLPHIDELVCNHLEFRDGEATGKLLDPVIGGHGGGRWLQDYAARARPRPRPSLAYGSHGPDMLLLAAVGRPCAVNPDFTLRRGARDADWPISSTD